MNKDKYVFAQLVEFLNKDRLRHIVVSVGVSAQEYVEIIRMGWL